MSRPRPGALAVVLLTAVAALAGCGDMPHTGPVVQGPRLGEDPLDAVPVQVQRGPRSDDSPEEIVRGFLRAAGGQDDEHQAALSYLDPVTQQRWRPDDQVAIYSGPDKLSIQEVAESATVVRPASPGPQPGASSTIVIRGEQVAMVDKAGRYVAAEPGTIIERRYGLKFSPGQGWRISEVAPGILISSDTFATTYQDSALYFPDRTRGYLVPDVRWLPATVRAAAATSIVEALLAGPSPWLAQAVNTAVPPGTRLTDAAVIGEDGTAAIDLTSEALDADKRDREIMVAQLRTTLTRASTSIKAIRVTVEGSEFDVDPVRVDDGRPAADGGQVVVPSWTSPYLRVDPDVGQRPAVVDKLGRVGELGPAGATPVEFAAALRSPGARGFAVAAGQKAFAVLDASGTSLRYLVTGGSQQAPAVLRAPAGTTLAAPSFDPEAWVWTAVQRPGTHLLAVRTTDGMRADMLTDVGEGTVAGVRLSRDGARAALAVRRGGRWQVRVAAVQRSTDDGSPLAVGPSQVLLPDAATVLDLAWADERTLLALTAAQGQPRLWQIEVGGPARDMGGVAGAVSLAAVAPPVGSSFTVYAGTTNGQVFVRQGASWRAVAKGSLPRFPG